MVLYLKKKKRNLKAHKNPRGNNLLKSSVPTSKKLLQFWITQFRHMAQYHRMSQKNYFKGKLRMKKPKITISKIRNPKKTLEAPINLFFSWYKTISLVCISLPHWTLPRRKQPWKDTNAGNSWAPSITRQPITLLPEPWSFNFILFLPSSCPHSPSSSSSALRLSPVLVFLAFLEAFFSALACFLCSALSSSCFARAASFSAA